MQSWSFNLVQRAEMKAKKPTAAAKPFLRWAGSKRSALPILSANAPVAYRKYIEPFAGSGALFFHISPTEAILSDLNSELINLYHQIKVKPKQLHHKLTAIPRDAETYYQIRSQLHHENDPTNRAVHFLYLNRNCFNGLYRTNKSGKFNVPYASKGRGEYPTESDFEQCSAALCNTTILNGDFEKIIEQHVTEGDFVYMDPPFIKSQGRIFNEYVKGHFAKDDIERLDRVLQTIHRIGAFFLLSLADDAICSRFATQWDVKTHMVQKNISGFASGRRKSSELLVKNY